MSDTSTTKVTPGHAAHLKESSDHEVSLWELTIEESSGSIIVKKKISPGDSEIVFRNINFGKKSKRDAYRRINKKLGEG